MFRMLAVLLIIFSTSSVVAQTAAPLPVTRVTLYTNGVGYFERTGLVSGDSSSTFYFPLEQVNDVLKSLVLLDYGGGTIEPVTYGAEDPVVVFRRFER